jgi:hypothetical protein
MTYRDETGIYYTWAPADQAYIAAQWLPPRNVGYGYFSRLAIDSQGELHLLITENVPSSACNVCFHIYYLRSDDDGITWSQPVDISLFQTGAAKPQIIIDKQDNLHVIWEAGKGGDLGQLSDPTTVMYTVSFDRGNTWTKPYRFPLMSGEQAKNIALGLYSKDKLIVAWLSVPDNQIYYQTSQNQGRSWSQAQPISGVWGASVTALDDYTMATDSAGNVHFVFVGRTTETEEDIHNLVHMTWDGLAWSTPDQIAAYTGDVPEWPRISISHGNILNVVWFVRNKAGIWNLSEYDYRVWYARSRTSAPEVVVTPLPTIVATTAATLTPIPASMPEMTLTPTLTIHLDSSTNTNLVYNEAASLIVIAKSLLPAALLIILVATIVYFRRRL